MDRVLRNTPATLSATWYENGVITDPGVVTVKIDRADGTNLVVAGTATSGTGAAARTYTLTIGQNNLLDVLTATWASATKGTIVTRVEIVGGFLFSVAAARTITPLNDTAKYPTADIEAGRTLAETALEEACGVAFVPRYARETVDGFGTTNVFLGRPFLRSVRSVSVDDTALTSTELLEDVKLTAGGIYRTDRFGQGVSNVIVAYEHGYDHPPPRVSQAALLLAKNWLIKGPLDDRTTSLSTEDGTFSLATPGIRGSTFGIPEVDQCIAQYGFSTWVA